MAGLKQAHGNWVYGKEHFWGREVELDLLSGYVDEGAHLLLAAQRRMGKTSLLREAARRLEDRYLCLFVDLQKSFSTVDAIIELSLAVHPHKSLWKKLVGVFSNALAHVSKTVDKLSLGELQLTLKAGLSAGNWRTRGDELLAILASSDKPVLLLLDEVPILVNRLLKGSDYVITAERRTQADEFMSWLRDNAIRHRGVIRFVVTGSIGLEPVLRQAGLSATMNNFHPFELPPWDAPTAAGCLAALAEQYGITFQDGAEEAMVQQLGYCVPHHVQMFFGKVHERCRRRGTTTFAAREVEELYQTEMLGIRGHVELAHYEERLRVVLGQEPFSMAIDLLTETAVVGSLAEEACIAQRPMYTFAEMDAAEVQQEILRVLQHDGYLECASQQYTFVSNLVRDWWKARHSFAFIPILRRRP